MHSAFCILHSALPSPAKTRGLFKKFAYDSSVPPPSSVADSPIPPALLRTPRTVRRKPGTLAPILLGRSLTAPLLIAAAVILSLTLFEPIVLFLLPAQPAHIVGQSNQYKTRRGTVYFIHYQFDRSAFTAQDQVLPNEYPTFQLGQPIKAHLIHLGPFGYSTLDRSPKAYARYRMILWLGDLFALSIGGVLFHALWLSPHRAHWLTQNGQATFGAVVQKTILHARRRHLHFSLTYQFKAHGLLRARQINISPARYDSAGVRDLVIILFDPARPGRNIVYDYSDFMAS